MKTVHIEVIIPDWANWIAQDEQGTWCAYENEPHTNRNWWLCFSSEMQQIAVGPPNPNWRETLRRVE